MKKITALLLAVMMVFAFTACGGSSDETATTEEPTINEVSGIVVDLDDANLSLYTDAKEDVTFNIENAAVESEGDIKKGDTATVEYEGEISAGDASGCSVKSVKAKAGDVSTLVGKVVSIDGDKTVTVSSNDTEYTFDTASVKAENGPLKIAETVKIKYTGIIEGEDTSHAFVQSVAVQEQASEEETYSIKAVDEAVWVSADVNIRAEANTSSAKVATAKKGQKLIRTGILSNGWSRVKYEDKDRYISSKFLTTKAPETEAKKTETKATETTKAESKTTETKATETKATESKSKTTETKATESKSKSTETKATETESKTTETKATETTSSETETTQTETTQTETTQTETTETETSETEPTEPSTATEKGTVEEYEKDKYIVLDVDNGTKYNITKDTKVDLYVDDDAELIGMVVQVEYEEDTMNAVHIFDINSSKIAGKAGNSGENSGGLSMLPTIFIILGLIAVAAAVIITIVRARRKSHAK